MYRLSLLIFLVLNVHVVIGAKNPHGPQFKIDCNQCHNPKSGWKVHVSEITYDHNSSSFELEGRHKKTDCRKCHIDLTFKIPNSSCVSCHSDVHQMTVGNDCARCHTADNWLINDVSQLHEQNGFPLEGRHNTVSCIECHKSSNMLMFNRMGSECLDCHMPDYYAAQNPNHVNSGFSVDCRQCHEPFSTSWTGDFGHDFFPLEKGHGNLECLMCHVDNNFTNVSPECVSCHQNDFNQTTNPNHQVLGFPTDCKLCHTTDIGWSPATFNDHDGLYFPIYSGKHQGTWSSCTECHTNSSNFSIFNCLGCHNDSGDLAGEHQDVSGYQYNSNACYTCHPDGSE
jgi:hypothetical protein